MSDSTDLSIILILVIGLILYIIYVRKIIDAQYMIQNKNCNPITMFINSINAYPADGVNNFAECVNSLDSFN
jgi:competence protein ComGC